MEMNMELKVDNSTDLFKDDLLETGLYTGIEQIDSKSLVIVLIQLVQYLVFSRLSEHRQILRFICIPCILILMCFLSIFCILCIPFVFFISCIFYILAVFIEIFKIKKTIFLEAFQRHWDFGN
ncbi:uncharacterized protein LOC111717531 [Eurytemora carolleeae]|uniref:uncharacterized protein LOC111717531 n=1 Tax=Eurytemora carolleeae TaxID=1294199 RepID=UPI000C763DB8|nr:uncharacterized protein LOC111717531 [Eurytemora carolleeae]XP_023348796.1 uncharacterized protein LOC111717531 [Eurytemora carolleeae]|eukprot:XP_023348795.1 uncharacterized protein LOC111717531 [Eurytemora affinis]